MDKKDGANDSIMSFKNSTKVLEGKKGELNNF